LKQGPRECPFFMTEEFAIHERLRYGPAIHLDERAVPAGRKVMNSRGNDLLARPRFSQQQDRTRQR
jgi:hypothetical protein